MNNRFVRALVAAFAAVVVTACGKDAGSILDPTPVPGPGNPTPGGPTAVNSMRLDFSSPQSGSPLSLSGGLRVKVTVICANTNGMWSLYGRSGQTSKWITGGPCPADPKGSWYERSLTVPADFVGNSMELFGGFNPPGDMSTYVDPTNNLATFPLVNFS